MKKGLVLEGGAMRGMFSAGIMDVLMENNIEFDGIMGVSAGATFGCNYKSGQIGRTIRYNIKYARDKRYCSLKSLITTGNLYGADFCYHELPTKLDVFDHEAFVNNPTEFYIVCTNIETGKPIYHKCENLDYNNLEWMRASASLPLVAQIVEVDGYKLLDGGITDSIPLKKFEEMGYEKNLVILTQPYNYIKKKNSISAFINIAFKKYPKLIDAIKNRHIMYNNETQYVKERENDGFAFVLRPKEALPIDRTEHNPKILQAVYDEGRKTALENLDKIKIFLSD